MKADAWWWATATAALLVAGCTSASPTSTRESPVEPPAPTAGEETASGAALDELMRAWVRGEAELTDHIDLGAGIALLTYYQEMADPPEAHPETGPDGYVKVARTECEGFESLETIRQLIADSGPEDLQCTASHLRCFYPAPDSGGGFSFLFREAEGRLLLDAVLHLDGDHTEEGQRLQVDWVNEHLELLRTAAHHCSE